MGYAFYTQVDLYETKITQFFIFKSLQYCQLTICPLKERF